MTDNDFEARINAEVEAGLAAELARKREELAFQARRRATAAEYDRINRKHPIESVLAGLTPEQDAERRRIMSEGVRRDMESMNASNAKVVDGDLRAVRAAGKGGSAGFTVK
jgi:hypothetical protein